MNDISVTIVAYKDYEDVKQVVTTMEEKTSQKLKKQVFIVDNSSSDQNTKSERQKLLDLIKSYDDITYLASKDNYGFGKGNNYVIPYLNSRYHAIVNPDIIFTEDTFSKIIYYMESNQEVGMVIPKIITENGEIQRAYRREVTIVDMFIRYFCKGLFKKRIDWHTLQDQDYSKPFQVPFAQGSFLVIRTTLFKEVGGFDERYFMYMEDADLSKQINKKTEVMYYPYTSVVHKWERGSHKNLKLLTYHIKSMVRYFNKWGIKWK